MALAIHGTPVNTHDTSGTATTIAASITTSVSNTIIIAVVAGYNSLVGGTLKTVSGVSGGGLTWAKRSGQSMHTTSGSTNLDVGLEVWWAKATGTLTAQSITATFNAAPNQRCDILVFAVSGSNNLSAPWDINASIPTSAQSSGNTLSLPSRGITTSATNSMLLGFLAYAWNGNAANTVGTGFTNILAATTDNSLRDNWEQKLVSSSGVQTIAYTGNQQFWVIASDALNGDAASGATGTITTTLTNASQSLAGSEKLTGTVATTLTKASQSLAGAERFIGTITTRLSSVAFAALTTTETMPGTIALHLGQVQFAASGWASATGTITTTLSKANTALSGSLIITGTIQTNLSSIAQHIAGISGSATGNIVTNLSPGIAQSLVGKETIPGTIYTRLGSADGHITANVIEALLIITGTIQTDLSKARPLILGAQLGARGAGPWYSWRQTDS
jgi:hypothetical protein